MNLDEFCRQFRVLTERKLPLPAHIEEGRGLLEGLLSDAEWFHGTLERILFDRGFPDQQKVSIWPNEIPLYRSPDGAFVVLAYLWEAGAVDVIHDHGSWGIIGELIHSSVERKYRRVDDGRKEGFAELEEISSRVVEPGETTCVLPLNEGIHQMRNPADEVAVSVNVYGRAVRKGYIQFFYPSRKKVVRVFPPRTAKEVFAVRILGSLGRPWAKDMLFARLKEPLADFLKKEYEDSLSRIKFKIKDGGL